MAKTNAIDNTFGAPIIQSITAVTDTINGHLASNYELTQTADFVMTSTPTIPDGTDGQILYLHNAGSFTIDIQDESTLTGSNILLDGSESTIKIDSVMTLMYSSTKSAWVVISNPNTASAGANATTLNVRNTSGTSITVGSPVYITGWNVGQNRPLIDLADANVSTSMPAIGVTATTIANGSNGEVITSGSAVGIIDTSTASVGDPVYISTTAGAVVFARPTVDEIQKIGEVARSHASAGVVIITGAGRTNDTPIAIPDLTTATTQTTGDNSTKLATTAYADASGGGSRTNTITSSATPTPAGDTTDIFTVTALAANATFAAPTGTPVNGQKLVIRIKDNATARTLAWNAIYTASTDLALPTTTVISKTMYLGFMYNSTDSKWNLLAFLDNI